MKQKHLPIFGDVEKQPKDSKSQELGSKPRRANQYLSSIWSYPGFANGQLYRWYGTLPRSLVEQLFMLYSEDPQTRVLDAFMGQGVVLEVAADRDLHAIGYDSNPLACLITEARLFGLTSNSSIKDFIDQVASRYIAQAAKTTSNKWHRTVGAEEYKYTRKWFRDDTLNAVLSLMFSIALVNNVHIQRLMFVSAAQVVREVASVDSRCTHHLVTKQKPFMDPLPLWREKVLASTDVVRKELAVLPSISIRQASVLDEDFQSNCVDFVIAHPPYLGVIHYNLIHRLATDLLDIVNKVKRPASLKAYDFGYARIKEADLSTDNTKSYLAFIEKFTKLMRHAISPNGRCVVIIGDQRHKGHLRHPSSEFINHFEANGFSLEENFIWILQNNQGMHVLRRGNFIDHNYILVFHKTSSS